ncbi:hypothetical protein Moror_14709 [Moniliophthora roreri MCA 2997]|nr:hypothetical protein Moror_14709 [Moniliophthora roreri MCA 2997]
MSDSVSSSDYISGDTHSEQCLSTLPATMVSRPGSRTSEPSMMEENGKNLSLDTLADACPSFFRSCPSLTLSSEQRSTPAPSPTFDGYLLPTAKQLKRAAELPVISESGKKAPFGSIWKKHKTIVIFIRHFMCPLCQDYLYSISRSICAGVLRTQGVDLVIVSNGDYEMIKSFRRIFQTPFAVYTDPTQQVYNVLGMIRSLEKGPRAAYVRHGTASGIGMIVANAAKVGMPIWKKGGDTSQLGGEFVLGPGLQCCFAHRMRYTRDHLPILKLVKEAGIDMTAKLKLQKVSIHVMTPEDEEDWMVERKMEFNAMMERKRKRRGDTRYCDGESCQLLYDSYEGS